MGLKCSRFNSGRKEWTYYSDSMLQWCRSTSAPCSTIQGSEDSSDQCESVDSLVQKPSAQLHWK